MYISVIGIAGSGKTTLFQALSGMAHDGQTKPNTIATIDVPDERLDQLVKIFNPRKTVHARIEVADTVAIEEGDARNETVSPKLLQQMRGSDALLLVLRHFDNGAPIDPEAEFRTIHTEFMLSDMAQIEARLERIKKQSGNRENPVVQQEVDTLQQCLAHLNDEKPLCTLPLFDSDGKMLRGFQFLSQKPMMVVVNVAEESLAQGDAIAANLKSRLPGNTPVLAACARLEAELALMPSEEHADLGLEYGIKESIRGRIIRLACETLGLVSFLTVGDDECRAWPIKKGITAQEAAGTIHTDFYNRFIRAETVSYEDFMKHRDFAACKKAGVWRLEGKTYIVQDGDILSIRAGS